MPLVSGVQAKKQHGQAEMMKQGLMIGTFVVFFGFTKLGMINKIFWSMIVSQSLVFVHKCNFYQRMIEDVASQMTLTGQEARIMVRYHMPNHPNAELYQELGERYKTLSAEQLSKHKKDLDKMVKVKEKEKKLDKDFAAKLASMEKDSLDEELPRRKRV